MTLETQRPCSHANEKREWSGTYTLVELAYAASLGYEIVYHELLLWKQHSNYLANISKLLMASKFRASKLPHGMTKEAYAAQVNETLQLPAAYQLQPGELHCDESAKSLHKLMLNVLIGKFGARRNTSRVELVTTRERLRQFVKLQGTDGGEQSGPKRTVDAMGLVTENCAFVAHSLTAPKQFNPNGNLAVTALINSTARIYMHRIVRKMDADSDVQLLSINCDGLVIASRLSAEQRLAPFGSGAGRFRREKEQMSIQTYSALGARQFSITYKTNAADGDDDCGGSTYEMGSANGLNFTTKLARDDESTEHFAAYIRGALQQKMYRRRGKRPMSSEQPRALRQQVRVAAAGSSSSSSGATAFATRAEIRNMSFPGNALFRGRVFKELGDGDICSFPHGFSPQMLDSATAAAERNTADRNQSA